MLEICVMPSSRHGAGEFQDRAIGRDGQIADFGTDCWRAHPDELLNRLPGP